MLPFLVACVNKHLDESGLKNHEILALCEGTDRSTLKEEAKRFLKENMDAHYSVSGDAIDGFHHYMDSIFSSPNSAPHAQVSLYALVEGTLSSYRRRPLSGGQQ